MPTLFQYMIKISACYAVVYFFYWLVLRRLTNYKSNRFYFLATSVFAFVISFWQPDVFVNSHLNGVPGFINYVPALNIAGSLNNNLQSNDTINISLIFLIIFIAGIVVCCSRFFIQVISLRKITSKAYLIDIASGVKLYHLDMDVMPFSFGKAVYINKHKHTLTEFNDIIKHESAHVNQLHIIDVMLAEVICILNWYNPFAWLIKRAMKQNLEFLADDAVINNGTNKKAYQYLLLKVTGYSPLNIVSSFKLSSLKQRICMMNKTKTSKKHLLKFFLVLPLLTITMLAFRNDNSTISSVTNNNVKEDTFVLTELTYNIPDAHIDNIVKNAQNKSLLQVGKPVTISLVMNEKDRLKTLLEKNGYNNISNHAITFLIDTTQAKKSFAVQVDIDLLRKSLSLNKTTPCINNNLTAASFNEITQRHVHNGASPPVITKQAASTI